MADYYQLVVEKRESIGSAANKFLRRNGKVPANYYYKETDNINVPHGTYILVIPNNKAAKGANAKIIIKSLIDTCNKV